LLRSPPHLPRKGRSRRFVLISRKCERCGASHSATDPGDERDLAVESTHKFRHPVFIE
jgi:hypothetical protein